MPITLDSTSSGERTSAGTTTTVSHTVVSNSNGILLVCTSYVDASIVSGVTYSGDAMTLVAERNDGDYKNCQIWRLLVPDTGTHDIVVSHTSTSTMKIFGVAFIGVDQTSPTGATAGATGTGSTPSSAIVTTKNNSVIISVVSNSNSEPTTPGTGQTLIDSIVSNSHGGGASYESKATAGSDTQTWANSSNWSMVSIEVNLNVSTQTIQPSTKDNYILSSSTDANNGNATELKVLNLAAAIHRTLITFDVSAYIAGSSNINSVKLNLYYYTNNGDYDPVGLQVNAYKMLRNDWSEGDGTSNTDSNWTDYKTGTTWATAGCGNTTSDYTITNSANTTFPASYGWLEWDITNIVKDAIDNNSSIVNLMVRFNDESLGTNYSNTAFYSREEATQTTLRPKLVIDYTNPTISIFESINVSENISLQLSYLLTSDLISYWKLDGNSNDATATANNGTDTNINYTGLLYERYNTGNNNHTDTWDGANNRYLAQPFTVGNTGANSTHTIDSVDLMLWRGENIGTITVEIRTTSAGVPTTTVLASGTYNGNLLPTSDTSTFVNIPVSSVSLSASTQYAIVVHIASSSGTLFLAWDDVEPTGGYTGGVYCYSVDNINWTTATRDLMFNEYSSSGKINQGSAFNGTTSKITLGSPIAIPTDVSVSAWIKKVDDTAGIQTIFGDANAGATIEWELSRTVQKLLFGWWSSASDYRYYETDNNVITDTNWHLVTVTQSGTGAPIFYVDGSSVASSIYATSGANTKPMTGQGTTIGKIGLYNGQFYNGAIDEVGLWSRALTSGEVASLYGGGNGLAYPLEPGIQLSESITVSENISLQITTLFLPLISESVTISENIVQDIFFSYGVFEPIVVSENIDIFIQTLYIFNIEDITISDIFINGTYLINIFELITISEEFYTVIPVLFLSVSDDITVSEYNIIDILIYIENIYEIITTNDNIHIYSIDNTIDFEFITVSEYVNLEIVLNISINNSIIVTDNIGIETVLSGRLFPNVPRGNTSFYQGLFGGGLIHDFH